MSEDGPAGDSAQAEVSKPGIKLPAGTLECLTKSILEDVLYNVISSVALSCHRAEKLLRMSSAATQVESLAISALESQPQVKGAPPPPMPPVTTTPAAVWENGRIYLKGNPLKTTTDIICPHCKLPRLMYPISGKGAQTPDLTKEYCMLYPWVQRQGHDVYGNPFPDGMAKSKKERELMRQQQKNADKESVGTPGSQDTEIAGGEGGAAGQSKEIKLNTGGKPASYIPWHTCPNCKRSLLITRFAQHLEKCLGISGRQSSRNAMAKLTGNGNGTGMANTPLGSRMGTPVPGSQGGGTGKDKDKRGSPVKKLGQDEDDAEDNETPEKKKKKKSSYIKKADREKMGLTKDTPALKVKLKAKDSNKDSQGGDAGSAKRLPKKNEHGEKADGKRDREEGGEEAPRKKIKLTLNKEDSLVSTANSETGSNANVGNGKGGEGDRDTE
ncbi:hypothetical protein K432DRAFT_388660 [Lepidopterella palustris CBS 459.81]|uniref:SAGA-associated factor 11 n=1 Tax=Lepidopterella palustris CBS 459.81 TaxID=1314670 RepID=A0A8E2EK03_9PEZI|nr:hypothetical protein K432DRAFT_388660 [Lepidopterella palustris CBS 459.81]